MSKAKIINKTNIKSEPTKDIDNNKLIDSDDEQPKKVKKNNKKVETIQVQKEGDVEKKDENDYNSKTNKVENKKKRPTKNEIYKTDQNKLFMDLKSLININTKNNSFLSEDVSKKNGEITGDILERMRKYHDANLSRGIKGTETKSSIQIIKKIFDCHGFEIISKEYNNSESRGFKYYIIPNDE